MSSQPVCPSQMPQKNQSHAKLVRRLTNSVSKTRNLPESATNCARTMDLATMMMMMSSQPVCPQPNAQKNQSHVKLVRRLTNSVLKTRNLPESAKNCAMTMDLATMMMMTSNRPVCLQSNAQKNQSRARRVKKLTNSVSKTRNSPECAKNCAKTMDLATMMMMTSNQPVCLQSNARKNQSHARHVRKLTTSVSKTRNSPECATNCAMTMDPATMMMMMMSSQQMCHQSNARKSQSHAKLVKRPMTHASMMKSLPEFVTSSATPMGLVIMMKMMSNQLVSHQ